MYLFWSGTRYLQQFPTWQGASPTSIIPQPSPHSIYTATHWTEEADDKCMQTSSTFLVTGYTLAQF